MHSDRDSAMLAAMRLDRGSFLGASAGMAAGRLGAGPARPRRRWCRWAGGHDEPLKLGSFLKDNDISLATTYINTDEEIITRLRPAAPARRTSSRSTTAISRS